MLTFIARVFRYLFWVLVVTWAFRLLSRVVSNMARGAAPANRPLDVASDAASGKLVRDPVCGLHIAEGLALPVRQGAELVHFCSAECRDKYLGEPRKFAANA
jgi:YHS domain-containing protein